MAELPDYPFAFMATYSSSVSAGEAEIPEGVPKASAKKVVKAASKPKKKTMSVKKAVLRKPKSRSKNTP